MSILCLQCFFPYEKGYIFFIALDCHILILSYMWHKNWIHVCAYKCVLVCACVSAYKAMEFL